jgi:hypothetical protein
MMEEQIELKKLLEKPKIDVWVAGKNYEAYLVNTDIQWVRCFRQERIGYPIWEWPIIRKPIDPVGTIPDYVIELVRDYFGIGEGKTIIGEMPDYVRTHIYFITDRGLEIRLPQYGDPDFDPRQHKIARRWLKLYGARWRPHVSRYYLELVI